MADRLLTPRVAAHIMGVDTRTLRNWSRDRGLPSIELPSGHHRYRLADLLAFDNSTRRWRP